MPERKPFHSFKKIVNEMKSPIELVSFHSISKGFIGECGRRGGYFECHNLDPQVKDQLYKLASISLCPTVQGQIGVDLMVRPPREGDPSYQVYKQETEGIYASLQRRAKKLVSALNRMEGMSCQEAEGAMYVFPRIMLSKKAVEEARRLGKQPDAFYVLEMLKATGVVCVPGSGFGQQPGTYHFRSTFLPPEHVFDDFIQRIGVFHRDFMRKYE
jgi:alanine transaminase